MLKMKYVRLSLIGLATSAAIVMAAPVMRADTHIQTDSWFGVGGGWSTGNKTLQFAYSTQSPVIGYYLLWTGNYWASVTDYEGSGAGCCGYGRHVKQTTAGSSNVIMYFTNDGNLLMLDGSSLLWETYTGNNYNGFFDLQDDGNLVVRTQSGTPLWSIF
jgi:hypothetical protein